MLKCPIVLFICLCCCCFFGGKGGGGGEDSYKYSQHHSTFRMYLTLICDRGSLHVLVVCVILKDDRRSAEERNNVISTSTKYDKTCIDKGPDHESF